MKTEEYSMIRVVRSKTLQDDQDNGLGLLTTPYQLQQLVNTQNFDLRLYARR